MPDNTVAATFTFTPEDLETLTRGQVPEWLRFDADAVLVAKDAEEGKP